MQSDFQKMCPRQRKRVAKNVLMAKKTHEKPQNNNNTKQKQKQRVSNVEQNVPMEKTN